jgi:MFS transporter, MHS family, alpha-ketoglutarate permease
MTATQEPMPTTSAPTAVPRRAMLGLGLGNTLEWYDWQIFGLLAAYIGPSFFATTNPVSATLNALGVFAVGFFFRPLGGVLFGNLADRIGRRRVMLWSVGTATATMLVYGLLPTQHQIGVWAAVLLVVCRVFQGLSTGIEAPLSTAYAVELVPGGREGRAAGYISFFVNFGILLASLVSFLVSLIAGGEAMSTWGWRVPILFGAVLGLTVLYLRRLLPESLDVAERTDTNTAVWGGVRKHWLGLVAIVVVVGAVQVFNYAWSVGLPTLARGSFGENPTGVFAITTALGVLLVVGALVVGHWADRIKLSRAFIIGRVASIPVVFLALLYAGPGLGMFTVVLLAGGLVLVVNLTLYNVVATSLMPKFCRATGTGIGYGIGVALFGGTASYLLIWLQSKGLSAVFPVYAAVLGLVSVVLYVLARRHSGTFAGE